MQLFLQLSGDQPREAFMGHESATEPLLLEPGIEFKREYGLDVWGAVCVKTKMLAVTYVFRERSYSRRRSCMDTVFHGDDFYSRRRSCMDTVFHGDDFYSRRRSCMDTVFHGDDLSLRRSMLTATIYDLRTCISRRRIYSKAVIGRRFPPRPRSSSRKPHPSRNEGCGLRGYDSVGRAH